MKKRKAKRTLISIMILVTGITIGKLIPDVKIPKQNSHRTLAMYIENESGGYDLSNQTSFPTDGYVLNTEKSSCRNGGTISQDSKTKKLSVSVSNKDECTVYFDKERTASGNTLSHLNQNSNGIKTNFDEAATTDEGIFEMEDDYGTSYYYRGAVENNYVKYGVNASGQEMWWRIIRVNGDGSLRIVYDGTQGYANGTNGSARYINTDQSYNRSNDAKYVGWMYGPAGTTASTSKEQAQSNIESSFLKKIVDAWYKENIVATGYGNNVSDEIFCNDRSTYNTKYDRGFGEIKTYYGARERMKLDVSEYTGAKPTFKCPQKNDAFTVSDEKVGNGDLTYPVGLITADEIVAAGSGKYGTNNSKYYLYHGVGYMWSLSPYYIDYGYAHMFLVEPSGNLGYTTVDYPSSGKDPTNLNNIYGSVTPVINLSSEYVSTMVGAGTITNPYRAP